MLRIKNARKIYLCTVLAEMGGLLEREKICDPAMKRDKL